MKYKLFDDGELSFQGKVHHRYTIQVIEVRDVHVSDELAFSGTDPYQEQEFGAKKLYYLRNLEQDGYIHYNLVPFNRQIREITENHPENVFVYLIPKVNSSPGEWNQVGGVNS